MIQYKDDDEYRKAILDFFKIDDYDEDVLRLHMEKLYQQIKDHSAFKELLISSAALFLSDDPEIGMAVQFSYDHFANFQKLLEEHKIKLS